MKINYLYRISDKSNVKEKLYNSSKLNCLTNFLKEFNVENLHVFADNCGPQIIQEIKALGIPPIITSLGNSASLRHIMQYSIDFFKQEDFVYLIEDDYIHLPSALNALREGLKMADYVSFLASFYPFKDLTTDVGKTIFELDFVWVG